MQLFIGGIYGRERCAARAGKLFVSWPNRLGVDPRVSRTE